MDRFTIPSGLYRARPRDVRLTVGGWLLMIFTVLLFAAAPTAGILMYREATAQREDQRLLIEASTVTAGTVTRLWRDKGEKKPAWASYAFEANGRQFSGRSKLPIARWQALGVGSPLDIRFVEADPSRNIPDGVSPRALPLVLPFIMAATLMGGGAACLFAIRRQRTLLRDGRVAQATVTKHEQHRSQHGTHRSMLYQFPTMNGVTVNGKSATSSKPPAIGSPICVLFDADRPARNAPYPLSLVRLADPGSV